MNSDVLRASLLELLHALGGESQRVLLAGGYGLYLKQLHLAEVGRNTLIPVELWPAPRATQDLDLVLSTEIVADAKAMQTVRTTMDQLGYVVVEGSEYLQFNRTISGTQVVKIDLLTAQLDVLRGNPLIKTDSRRARPATGDKPQLHAHPTDGALALDESPLQIELTGRLANGESVTAHVNIPHPFSHLLMKLTAYRDRRGDADKELGRHHALDVFRIVAMLTEREYEEVRQCVARFATNAQVQSCAEQVQKHFADRTGAGLLAMREHALWQNDEQIEQFIEAITGLFPTD